jgi:hypothetical protein
MIIVVGKLDDWGAFDTFFVNRGFLTKGMERAKRLSSRDEAIKFAREMQDAGYKNVRVFEINVLDVEQEIEK